MHIDTITASVLIQEGTEQIAGLRDDANEGQVADHIRGMVAATMGILSIQASVTTRNDAEQWQQWALGVAEGLEQPVLG
jgi:hypothetical protein